MWKQLLCSLLAATFTLAAGCSKGKDQKAAETEEKASERIPDPLTPEQASKLVARVGKSTITVGDVTEQINRLSPYIRRRWAAPEKRREFLQKLIRIELLSQEAIALGLENDPEVQNTLKQVMIRLMVTNDLQKDYLPSSVDDATLKAEYDKQINTFRRPPEIRVSHIVVASEDKAGQLIAALASLKPEDRTFRERAQEESIDKESAERGGDVGYFAEPVDGRDVSLPIPLIVAQAAWKLREVGDVAKEPIKSEQGYHVIRLTNRKPELNRSFESVKRLLENRLLRDMRREKMDQFVAGLKKKATIEVFEENLAAIRVVDSPASDAKDKTGAEGTE